MLVWSRRHDDATRVISMLELTRFTNTIEKRNQYNKYNQNSKHVKEHHIDDTHDDKHRIIEATQNRHDLRIEKEKVSCSVYIEFSLKKKFWVEWKITKRLEMKHQDADVLVNYRISHESTYDVKSSMS